LGLYPRYEKWWDRPLKELVGLPFPFPTGGAWRAGTASGISKPALADPRLRKKPMVVVIAYPFVSPYVGHQPPPEPAAWSRALAAPLHDTGAAVAPATMGGPPPQDRTGAPADASFLHLYETGDQPLGRWPPDGVPIILSKYP